MKRILAVINGDLGRYYSLSGGISIPSGADLNDYKTPGNYFCSSNAKASSLQNSPTNRAFIMKVEYSNGIEYPMQTVTEYYTGIKYFRSYNDESQLWTGGWNKYITNSDLATTVYEVPKPSNSSIYNFDNVTVYELYLMRSGNVVNLKANMNPTMEAGSDFSLMLTLPGGYRPRNSVIQNYITQTGIPMVLALYSDGRLMLYNQNRRIENRDWLFRQNITYIAAD